MSVRCDAKTHRRATQSSPVCRTFSATRLGAIAVRSQFGFVATNAGAVTRFLTLERHYDETSEITWMAVRADSRRRGIGRMLIDAAVRHARWEGMRMLCVLTLGPSEPELAGDNYEGTRQFYRAMGFVPLRELGLRDWNNQHTLMLARPLSIIPA